MERFSGGSGFLSGCGCTASAIRCVSSDGTASAACVKPNDVSETAEQAHTAASAVILAALDGFLKCAIFTSLFLMHFFDEAIAVV